MTDWAVRHTPAGVIIDGRVPYEDVDRLIAAVGRYRDRTASAAAVLQAAERAGWSAVEVQISPTYRRWFGGMGTEAAWRQDVQRCQPSSYPAILAALGGGE